MCRNTRIIRPVAAPRRSGNPLRIFKPAFQMHHQQCDGGRCDAGNVAGLADGFRVCALLVELFALHFCRQTFDFAVIDIPGQLPGSDVAAVVDFFVLGGRYSLGI